MLKRSISKILVLTLIFTFAFATSSVSAQDEVECGDIIEDEADGEPILYDFELDDDEVAIIELISFDFDAYIVVLDEDGEFYAQDDNSGEDTDSLLVLAGEGEYTIVATSFDNEPEGEFELRISCAGDCDVTEDDLEDDVLEVEIEAEEDDLLFISLTSNEFDTFLNLLDEDGDVLESNDDGGAGFNSAIFYEFDEDGEYIIEVTSFSGGSQGEFLLLVCEDTEEIEDVIIGDVIAEEVIEIQCGDVVEGEISDEDATIFYAFEGEDGDEVTITMTAIGDEELDPYLSLTAGETLAFNDDADGLNSEIVYELEEDNTYVIIASRFGGFDGSSEGEFELELECD